ncbi:hypothetical protein MASR2M66_27150 [Chloroflexota bacterium]
MNLFGLDLNRLFNLTEDGVAYRRSKRVFVYFIVWAILSGFTIVTLAFLVANNTQRGIIVLLGLLKYIPILLAITIAARSMAASYLADIYELEDVSIADRFIEEVAFGTGLEEITIDEGKISDEDERSPIILIGGPGYIQVNLDSVALLERADGVPEIIHPRSKPWKIDRFERIREIGKSDEIGKREYAIINLRDQFVRGLTVRARSKDGIPLEAQDIKIMFSILRKPKEEAPENNPYHFQESAVYSLVYDQAIISPPPSKTLGISFPWDTTVIPLVTIELEELIKSRNLSEILSNISEKELDDIAENEATNVQMRIEMTGENIAANRKDTHDDAPAFQSRSRITAQFFEPAFQKKAADMGVSIHWIDIGTWKLPNEIIQDELKNAWKMQRKNAQRRIELEHAGNRYQMQGLIDIVNTVVIGNYGKSGNGRKPSNKEYLEMMKIVEENPDISSNSMFSQSLSLDAASKRDAAAVSLEILKAFRYELIAARELIQKENRSPIDKQAEIARINKALHDIEEHVFHYIKGPK